MHTRNAARAISALAATGAAALLGGLAPAVAETPKPSSRTQPLQQGEPASVAATCGGGRKPVSGGYRSGANSTQFNSFEAIDGRTWSVSTVNVSNPGPFTTLAYCAKFGRGVKVRTEEATLTPDATDQATASCKNDERVISGGYAFVSAHLTSTIALKSFRDGPRSWTVSASNGSASETVTLVAIANCLPERKAPDIAPATNSKQITDGDSVSAKCARNRVAMSGGFKGEAVLGSSMRKGSRKWSYTVRFADPSKFTALVYCIKP